MKEMRIKVEDRRRSRLAKIRGRGYRSDPSISCGRQSGIISLEPELGVLSTFRGLLLADTWLIRIIPINIEF